MRAKTDFEPHISNIIMLNSALLIKNHIMLLRALVCICLKSNSCCTWGLGVKTLQIKYSYFFSKTVFVKHVCVV